MAAIQAHIKILPVKHPHLYQKLAQKATELHLLGMPYSKIGEILGIDPKTAAKVVLTLSFPRKRESTSRVFIGTCHFGTLYKIVCPFLTRPLIRQCLAKKVNYAPIFQILLQAVSGWSSDCRGYIDS